MTKCFNQQVNCSYRKHVYPRQQGTVLIIALVVVALIVGIAARFTSNFQLTVARTEQGIVSSQLQQFLYSVESFAGWVLIEDANADKFDHLGEDWTTELQAPIEEATITGKLEDALSRFNLNQLQEKLGRSVYKPAGLFEERYTVPQRRFIRLLQTHPDGIVGIDEAKQITEAIMDWLDSDSLVTGSGGAEDIYYQSLESPYRAANRLFANKTELRLVKGITKEIYEYLSPLIIALPDKNIGINVNTAPVEIIRTIHQNAIEEPHSEEDGARLIETRPKRIGDKVESVEAIQASSDQKEKAYEKVEDFIESDAANLIFGTDTKQKPNASGLQIDSKYFLLTADVKLLDYKRSQTSLLKRESTSTGFTTKVIRRNREIF